MSLLNCEIYQRERVSRVAGTEIILVITHPIRPPGSIPGDDESGAIEQNNQEYIINTLDTMYIKWLEYRHNLYCRKKIKINYSLADEKYFDETRNTLVLF